MEKLSLTLKKEMKDSQLLKTLREACKKIAPVWPLENFVAVNPYLGLIDKKFETVVETLANAGGIQMTLPISFYKKKIQEGKIKRKDIKDALSKNSANQNLQSFFNRLEKMNDEEQNFATTSTLIDIAGEITRKDWNGFVTSRTSNWAASYFDRGQASWKAADQNEGLFVSWKNEAKVDLTTEIAGLKGFRKSVKALPDDPIKAVQKSIEILALPEDSLPIYFHRLLLCQGGWSAYAAFLDWESELYGGKDGTLIEFLSVLICWEACLSQCFDHDQLSQEWMEAKKKLSESIREKISERLATKIILQDAFDLANQRELIEKFQVTKCSDQKKAARAKAQAIFCIDVRSEVFRRNLETADPEIETISFAGFFGFPINYVPLAHDHGRAQCPALIQPGPKILETIPGDEANHLAYKGRVLQHQLQQTWKSFKSGAITCFSFVSPMGLSYLPKLFSDSFGLTRPVPHPDKVGLKRNTLKQKSISVEVAKHDNYTVGIPLAQSIQMAKNALTAMSLTDNFARFVLVVGHASTTVNNPHATGLDCGACGGSSGEANAKVAAAVLNDPEVRKHLKDENILIPGDTLFLACLHDTTTDEISIYNEGNIPSMKGEDLFDLKKSLARAGRASRAERAIKMFTKGDVDEAIKTRSKDWSQVRPEWGSAGCTSFIVAPRKRTENIDFEGQAFLHSYDWKKDNKFSVLELIMTAPMVVSSWINLQYYASTVDNKNFGSGNKTLHNVTAGLGVLEGFSGDLRVGLPLQSVHDGEKYQHEPIRLNVVIEAPIDAMNVVLEKHESVRNLCDNGWIHLLAMNEEGKVSHRYEGNLEWAKI